MVWPIKAVDTLILMPINTGAREITAQYSTTLLIIERWRFTFQI